MAIIAAPFLFGAVTSEAQAIVGLGLATSLLFLPRREPHHLFPRWLQVAFLVWLFLPLLPLPHGLVSIINPARARLQSDFVPGSAQTWSWYPLTLSVTGTVNRLWQLALLWCAFLVGRELPANIRWSRHVCGWLALAMLGLALLPTTFNVSTTREIMGLWHTSWGEGRATFASRNHYANWLYLAALLNFGFVMRQFVPLRTARDASNVDHRTGGTRALGILVGAGVILGIFGGLSSASRGGLIAFIVGLGIWATLLFKWTKSRRRIGLAGLAAVGVLVFLTFQAEHLYERFTAPGRADTALQKMELWKDAANIPSKFPIFGTGPGTFVTAYNIYKTTGGNTTAWHAENDYLQWAVEHGLVGVGMLGLMAFYALRKLRAFMKRETFRHPELLFGAVAACSAFAAHAMGEFVSHVLATALLAAFIGGLGVGIVSPRSILPTTTNTTAYRAWTWLGVIVLLFSVLQLGAFTLWRSSLAEWSTTKTPPRLELGLRLWPFVQDRWVVATRLKALSISEAVEERRNRMANEFYLELGKPIRADPFHWELLLERFWFGVACMPGFPVESEAWKITKLNPQQAQIPLRFASFFSERNPPLAVRFLQSAPLGNATRLESALTLAWKLEKDPELLWELTPETPAGYESLARFAVKQGLAKMARKAYAQSGKTVSPASLAMQLLEANRVEAALRELPHGNESATLFVRANALRRLAKYEEATRELEIYFKGHHPIRAIDSGVVMDLDRARISWLTQKSNPIAAEKLAAALLQQSATDRDAGLLAGLAGAFPAEPSILRLQYETFLEVRNYQRAAEIGLHLMELALGAAAPAGR